MPGILALDIGTRMGWALHKPGMERPFFGTHRFASTPEQVGLVCEQMRLFLTEQHQLHKGITDFVFEAQHVAGSKIDINVIRKLIALSAMVEWFAHCVDARCYLVHIGTWRKHFLGTGRIGREEAKSQALDECRRIGIDPPDDNAAEAMGILDFYLSMKKLNGKPYPRPWRDAGFFTPLGHHA